MKIPIWNIDNVADYFFSFDADNSPDIPNVASPHDEFYLTYRLPRSKWARFLPRIDEWGNQLTVGIRSTTNEKRRTDDYRWLDFYNLWTPIGKRHLGTAHVWVKDDGSFNVSDIKGEQIIIPGAQAWELANELLPEKGIHDVQNFFDLLYLLMLPACLAISFSHCKNVKLIDEPLSRQQRRMKERKGGTYYKVLDIEPFKQQVRRETQPGESQLQRALHICRGHFATYTEDKPLFGKHTGTYWKPMHVRGNRASGKVEKDYQVIIDDD